MQNEILQGVIHSLLVMVDGGDDDLADNYLIDLVNRESGESLQEDIALHEEFMGFLLETEED